MRQITFSILLAFFTLMANGQDPDPAWRTTADEIDPGNYFGITVANGMIGLVSSPEPMKVQDVVLNGVYDYYQRGRVSNILKTFNHVNMELDVDGRVIRSGDVSNYTQTLDMKRAVLATTFEIGNKVKVRHEMMALRHLPYTALIRVEIEAREDVSVTPMAVIQAPIHLRDVRNYYGVIEVPNPENTRVRELFIEQGRPIHEIPLLTSVAESPTGRHTVAASSSFIFEEPHGEQPHVLHEDKDYDMHRARFTRKLKAGQTYRFALVASACSTEHYEDPQNEAERLTLFANLEGVERLVQKHEAAWADLWQSDIVIHGDPETQRDVRSMLYHLYSFARAGTAYSLSPMGLSGLGYNGHVFWDTEMWMFPPLLALHPEIARSLLEYRYERLEAARQNAFAHGYDGAMYPWESSDTGAEDTPVWALTGPFQHHITGDVGWACWKYYQVTRDKEWLRTRGYPILRAVADFWTSRVERNGPGQYDINNVIGANEFEENIDNNAFTNGMAVTVLRYAAAAARELGLTPDPDWEHVADNIPILTFPDGTTRENVTYEGGPIKQADVNLLAYPLDIIQQEERIRRDLAYYEPRLDPGGPAMAHSALAVIYARLGEAEKAYELFRRSYEPNEVPPFGVLAETAGGTNPYFATGAGGTLQVLIYGFGGLEITEEGMVRREVELPGKWERVEILRKDKR